MFFYVIEKSITNIYDGNELRVIGHVKCYTDEAHTQLLTELPFGDLGLNITVAECPTTSAEAFNSYIDNKAIEAVNQPEIQAKLTQIKLMKDLGLLK